MIAACNRRNTRNRPMNPDLNPPFPTRNIGALLRV
jgi:hypothetical protein